MLFYRKTAPRVVDGQVRRKNRWRLEPDYRPTHQIRIERVRPRQGYRHFVSPTDVFAFLGLLPNWRELAIGLQRILLDNNTSCLGWHRPGTVALCAWEEYRTTLLSPDFYTDHADTLQRLRVPCYRVLLVGECSACNELPNKSFQEQKDDQVCINCGLDPYDIDHKDVATFFRSEHDSTDGVEAYFSEWTDETIQAFQLIHVLVHELGHHHDRMTSPRQRDGTRGEKYAEEYALKHEEEIWFKYCRVFRVR
jgi:hypothetical protein